MAEESRMPKVDMKAEFDNLSPSQQYYVKKLNRLNQTRYEANQKMRKGGRRTGLFLTGVACGICILDWLEYHTQYNNIICYIS